MKKIEYRVYKKSNIEDLSSDFIREGSYGNFANAFEYMQNQALQLYKETKLETSDFYYLSKYEYVSVPNSDEFKWIETRRFYCHPFTAKGIMNLYNNDV